VERARPQSTEAMARNQATMPEDLAMYHQKWFCMFVLPPRT
jgi:hypothetical protein